MLRVSCVSFSVSHHPFGKLEKTSRTFRPPSVVNESRRMQVRSLALLSELRLWRCHELWCRLQIRLGSCIAVTVVQASSYSSDLIPGLGTSICRRCSPKKQKYKEKRHLLIPNSQSISAPCPLPLGNHKSVLHVCESLSVV